jgi:hypothetical protein
MSDEIVRHYMETYDEEARLQNRIGPFEYERTIEIISRYVGHLPRIVVDVGGGTGAYTLWLAKQGHEVHFIDLVPNHVESMVDRDLMDGQHRNPDEANKHLGTAFLHSPQELRLEIQEAGLKCEKMIGIESPIALIEQMEEWIQEWGRMYDLLLKYARHSEEEENLLGASFHLLGIGRRL